MKKIKKYVLRKVQKHNPKKILNNKYKKQTYNMVLEFPDKDFCITCKIHYKLNKSFIASKVRRDRYSVIKIKFLKSTY